MKTNHRRLLPCALTAVAAAAAVAPVRAGEQDVPVLLDGVGTR
jgi:hypothetical protein